MDDADLLGFLTHALLGKAFSLAADEISLTLGLSKELKKLAGKLELIQALLSDAQSKQLASKAVELWLKNLKRIALDAQIVLDDYGYEVLHQKIQCRKRDKVLTFFSSSNPLYFGSSMGHKIRDVLTCLDRVYAESNQIGLHAVGLISSLPDLNKASRLTDPFVEESEIVGRDDDASEVIRMLTDSDYGKEDLHVITILGMGGQGKTTLAQVVYKHEQVGSYFDKKVWLCVSDDFNVGRLLAQMLESLTQTTCQLSSREGLVNKLKEELSGKRYLLVLDDVWNESRDEWDGMRRCLLEIGGSKGSKIMATTRSENVGCAMRTSGYHRLQILSEDQSLDLFERCAFAKGGAIKTPELVAIGQRILKRCGGVPLAIKAVGGLLYSKDSESEWSLIDRSDLWSTESGVLTAIKLSYDQLPSFSLKQCFAYCAIFPKDTKLKRNALVQHWMAHGFLNPPKGSHLQMEDVGNMYFNVLLRSSLLQDAQVYWRSEPSYKMHDLVHDFSSRVSETCCIDIREGTVGKSEIDTVHLRVISDRNVRHDKSFKGIVSFKLRSLTLDGWFQLDDWFDNFRCLTTLTIDFKKLEKLPKAIGKITHLRFLDICNTSVYKLPKSFVELYYLETLRCHYLSELPEGFVNLINLRHLYAVDRPIKYLIPRLGQLTNIQTVPFFKVDKSKGCHIKELEHLDNLTGTLRIFGLENVSDCKSASRSKLWNKASINSLELYWVGWKDDCDGIEVMKGLMPHPDLKALKIDGYRSRSFPPWIILLHHLTNLTLMNLDTCEQLPSLGVLPCLEVLAIQSSPNVKSIGKEFYGWSNFDLTSNRYFSNGAEITLFPALKLLSLYDMCSLQKWSDAFIPTHSSAKAFPSLEKMFVARLPNLSVFPNLGSLPCLQSLYMSHCPNLALPSDWNSPMPHILEADETSISIHSAVDTDNDRDIHYLPSLLFLEINDCDKLVAPFCNLTIFAKLKTLYIGGNASFWPKDLQNLINLESIVISGGDSSTEMDSFPLPYLVSTATHCLGDISLRSLTLRGWSKITSLPDQIQYLISLRVLRIQYFEGLEALPEWLGCLKCLEELHVKRCKNLKQFPSAEALKGLSNLRHLVVSGCPLLEERYAKEGCPEWRTIAHIPKIIFPNR